jgi:hypothetical protein
MSYGGAANFVGAWLTAHLALQITPASRPLNKRPPSAYVSPTAEPASRVKMAKP